MKVTCRYSGVTYEVQNFGGLDVQRGQHPLMDDGVSLSTLQALYASYHVRGLNKAESRILFIAMLKYTKLVRFGEHNRPIHAQPSMDVIMLNMEPLARFVGLMDVVVEHEKKKFFPEFIITPNTAACPNIHTWIEACLEGLDAWRDNRATQRMRERLDNKEEIIMKILKSPYEDQDKKLDHIAHWAMLATDAPKDMWQYWIPVFKLKGMELYQTYLIKPVFDDKNQVTKGTGIYLEWAIDGLWDWLQTKLAKQFSSYSPTIAREVLLHINTILHDHKKGLAGAIGLDADELKYLDIEALKTPSFRIIDEDDKAAIAALDGAPNTKPERSDYPDLVSYLSAKAKWELAKQAAHKKQHRDEALKQYEEDQAKKLQQDALDNMPQDNEDILNPKDLGIDTPDHDDETDEDAAE